MLAQTEQKVFDAAWEADRQRKIAREQRDLAAQHEREQRTMHVLREQLQQLEERAGQEQFLKQEEARAMKEAFEHQALEAERKALEKEREQKAMRLVLDKSKKEKMVQQAAQFQKELEFDLAVLEEYMRQEQEDRDARNRRKVEWKQEIFAYRAHLLEQRQVERQRNIEVERLHAAEQDRVWATRALKWRKEQQARDKLMQEVMETRQKQLQEQVDAIRVQRAENLAIKQQLEKVVTQAKEEAVHKEQERLEKGQEYKQFLMAQIRDTEERAVAEEARLQQEEQVYLVSAL
jgi:cilia- and flagella-associated protein 53